MVIVGSGGRLGGIMLPHLSEESMVTADPQRRSAPYRRDQRILASNASGDNGDTARPAPLVFAALPTTAAGAAAAAGDAPSRRIRSRLGSSPVPSRRRSSSTRASPAFTSPRAQSLERREVLRRPIDGGPHRSRSSKPIRPTPVHLRGQNYFQKEGLRVFSAIIIALHRPPAVGAHRLVSAARTTMGRWNWYCQFRIERRVEAQGAAAAHPEHQVTLGFSQRRRQLAVEDSRRWWRRRAG